MKKLPVLMLAVMLLLFGRAAFVTQVASAQGQADGFTITMSRDFGYGGAGEIQGLFSIHVNQAPEDLARVEFFIDTTRIGEDSQAPFAFQFNTDNYPAGQREIYAIGYTQGGSELTSNKIHIVFISAEEIPAKTLRLVGPILGVVLLAVALGFIIPMLLDRRRGPTAPGTQRNYGFKGGTICPRCNRPYVRHLFSINMGFSGQLDHCPHCGKWAVVRRKSLEELRRAEQAELAAANEAPQINGETEEEKLRKELEDSRYRGV